MDHNYTSPVDLARNGILFGAKSIVITIKSVITIQIWFTLIRFRKDLTVKFRSLATRRVSRNWREMETVRHRQLKDLSIISSYSQQSS